MGVFISVFMSFVLSAMLGLYLIKLYVFFKRDTIKEIIIKFGGIKNFLLRVNGTLFIIVIFFMVYNYRVSAMIKKIYSKFSGMSEMAKAGSIVLLFVLLWITAGAVIAILSAPL